MTPRTLLESFGPRLPCKNLFDGNRMRRTNYFHHSLQNGIFKNLQNLPFFFENASEWLSESFEIQKLLPPHVCDHKNRSTRRTPTPFVSADTHGPKDVLKSKF